MQNWVEKRVENKKNFPHLGHGIQVSNIVTGADEIAVLHFTTQT